MSDISFSEDRKIYYSKDRQFSEDEAYKFLSSDFKPDNRLEDKAFQEGLNSARGLELIMQQIGRLEGIYDS